MSYKEHGVFANEVFRIDNTYKTNGTTYFEGKDDNDSTKKYLNTVGVGKQKLLEPFSATNIIATTKSRDLQQFDSDSNLITSLYPPAKVINEALRNHLFFILVTRTSKK